MSTVIRSQVMMSKAIRSKVMRSMTFDQILACDVCLIGPYTPYEPDISGVTRLVSPHEDAVMPYDGAPSHNLSHAVCYGSGTRMQRERGRCA